MSSSPVLSLISSLSMPFAVPIEPPNPDMVARTRDPDLPEGAAQTVWSGGDENLLTNGYFTPGTHINKGRYQISERIGKGSYGAVVRALDHFTNQTVAIKFHFFSNDAFDEMRVYNELYRDPDLTKIPRIEQFFRFFHNGVPYIAVVMEELGPSIFRTVHHCSTFPIPFATLVLQNILEGMQYLHDRIGIAHLDVSPANIVFSKPFPLQKGTLPPSCHIRIIDFNTSERDEKIGDATRYIHAYRAPEVCMNNRYKASADIWAVGSMGFFMIKCFDLFQATNDKDLLHEHQIALGPIPVTVLNLSFGNDFVQFNGFFDNTFKINQDVVYTHPGSYDEWFLTDNNMSDDEVDYMLLLKQMFEIDCTKRLPAARLLEHPLFARFYDPNPEPRALSCALPAPVQNPFTVPDWAVGAAYPHHITVADLPDDAILLPQPPLPPLPAFPILPHDQIPTQYLARNRFPTPAVPTNLAQVVPFAPQYHIPGVNLNQQPAYEHWSQTAYPITAHPVPSWYLPGYFGPTTLVDPTTGAPLACPYQPLVHPSTVSHPPVYEFAAYFDPLLPVAIPANQYAPFFLPPIQFNQ